MKRTAPLLILVIAAFANIFVCNDRANAADCLKDSWELQTAGGKVLRMRDYLCRGERSDVRVQFHRVNDRVMGELLSGGPPNALLSAFGNDRLVYSDVYREWFELLHLFGETTTSPIEFTPSRRQCANALAISSVIFLASPSTITVLSR